MTHLSRPFSAFDPRWLTAVVFVLVISLRTAVAPAMVAADDPGVMTICAGGQVYYVTLDGTPVDPDEPHTDPCPYNGMTLALSALAMPDLSHSAKPRITTLPLPDAPAIEAPRARQNTPRAPPFPV